MAVETNLDNTPLATGTHKGDKSTVLSDPGADFKSCGVAVGSYIENDTTGAGGAISALTEDTVTANLSGGTDASWANGDTYNIYRTATKDSEISRIYTDRRFGRKVLKRTELNGRGHFHDDEDWDADRDRVFGPSQPRQCRGRG
jgi:hypothetical protein